MFVSLYSIISLLCFINLVICNSQPQVTIPSGTVSGIDITLSNGKIIQAFLGIPYALPPVGENRFEEPKPYDKWEGIWNGSTFSRSCMQFSLLSDPLEAVTGEEDCLYLNIFTPKLPQSSTQPLNDVIVFLHGGSFMFGSGNYVIPDYLLAMHDVVFVYINYRLAMFGFYSTDDDVVPGNNGLKDQIMALRWIQRNINKFGGNPRSVTLAGNSAGSASVHFLLLSELGKDLFHKAIMTSGTVLQPWLLLGKSVSAISRKLASIAGCPTKSTRSMVDCLKTRPSMKLADSFRNFQIWRHLGYLFGPVIEPPGRNRVLQDDPLVLIRNKKDTIPCLVSVVQDEGFVGLNNFINNERILEELDNNFNAIAPYMLFYFHKLPENQYSKFADKIRQHFFHNQSIISDENYPKLIQMLGNRLITSNVEFVIREHTEHNFGPIYYSVFNYSGEHSILKLYAEPTSKRVLGVSHSDDMIYLMRSTFLDNKLRRPEDMNVSKLMANIWASFAKSGKPEINTTNLTWPAVSHVHKKGIAYLRINSADDLKIQYRYSNDQKAFNFWNNSLNEFTSSSQKRINDEF
ncbi:esterase E4-like [Planococcus citri]|uniref:esterase E4-like n=1 Tax=Planococcus citri TaxID=170843 RepID=UPI0031FA3649